MLLEFGFSTEFLCGVFLLYFQNTLMVIDFDVLKYIKSIFKLLK